MITTEEFNSLVGEKVDALKIEMQKEKAAEATRLKEESEAFANAVIEFLCSETRGFTEYGRKLISHKEKFIKDSDYVVESDNKRYCSCIDIDPSGVMIQLLYPYRKKYNPFENELNRKVVEEILDPYYVYVSYIPSSKCDFGRLIISYDHAKKIREQQINSETKQKKL